MKKKIKTKEDTSSQDKKFPLPLYSEPEDIYNTEKEIPFEEEKENILNDNPGSDLDVPGSELDDADEEIGEEDEENNYYSLGGDSHEDLEEDKGENP